MATYSLRDYLEDDAVVLEDIPSTAFPEGKAYGFESPTFEVGLWLKNLVEFGQRVALGGQIKEDDLGKLILDDDEETETYRRVMGDTFDEMRADGVKWAHVQEIFKLLLKKWGNNQDIAASLREAAEGEAAARANRADRRAAAKKPAAKKQPARSSSRKAGSKSSPASSAANSRASTRATGQASTRSSAASGAGKAAAKTA